MKRIGFFVLGLCLRVNTYSQFLNFSPTSDTTAKVTLEGYIDTYFNVDSANPPAGDIPYFVSQNRNIETNINLAFIKIKYSANRVRATFIPGFGTYMNSNYAAERITLGNIVEANVGVRLIANKSIWLDAGVINSPFTNESAISFDQPTLTRSFAPEYVPYYITGVRLSIPMGRKFKTNLFMLNGWQVIEDINTPLAFASQFEYKPNHQLTLNLNTYFGDEESTNVPANRMRSFIDFYTLYKIGKLSYTFSAYLGNQQRRDSLDRSTNNIWWQINGTARYYLTDQLSITLRYEHFDDPKSMMIVPVNGGQGFISDSYTLGYCSAITPSVLFRLEGRYFQSPKDVFNDNHSFSNNHTVLTAGLTAKF